MVNPNKIKIYNPESTNEKREEYIDTISSTYNEQSFTIILVVTAALSALIFRREYLAASSNRAPIPLSLLSSGIAGALFYFLKILFFGGDPFRKLFNNSYNVEYEFDELPEKSEWDGELEIDSPTEWFTDKLASSTFSLSQSVSEGVAEVFLTPDAAGYEDTGEYKVYTLNSSSSAAEENIYVQYFEEGSNKYIYGSYVDINALQTGKDKIVIEKKYYTEKFAVADLNGETILKRNTIYLYFKASRDDTKFNLYLIGDSSLETKVITTVSNLEYEVNRPTLKVANNSYNNLKTTKIILKNNIFNGNYIDKVVNNLGNPTINARITFFTILLPFILLNTNIRRKFLRMEYLPKDFDTINLDVLEETLYTILGSVSVGILVYQSSAIFNNILPIGRVSDIKKLLKQEFFEEKDDEEFYNLLFIRKINLVNSVNYTIRKLKSKVNKIKSKILKRK